MSPPTRTGTRFSAVLLLALLLAAGHFGFSEPGAPVLHAAGGGRLAADMETLQADLPPVTVARAHPHLLAAGFSPPQEVETNDDPAVFAAYFRVGEGGRAQGLLLRSTSEGGGP